MDQNNNGSERWSRLWRRTLKRARNICQRVCQHGHDCCVFLQLARYYLVEGISRRVMVIEIKAVVLNRAEAGNAQGHQGANIGFRIV